MGMRLNELSVIDSHCHPFLPSMEAGSFESNWTLSNLPVGQDDLRSTVLVQMMRTRLARFLDLDDPSFETLAERRAACYQADPVGYVNSLFADAGLRTLLVDVGYPSLETEGYEADLDDFRSLARQCEVRFVIGIERVLYSLLRQGLGFAEFVEAYRAELGRQVVGSKAVALKSTIAYHTGLDIQIVHRDRAKKAYTRVAGESHTDGAPQYGEESRSEDAKYYRDFMLLETIDFCLERGLPLQLHTGMGAVPAIDVRLSNPLHLRWLISDSHYGAATIVLVHAGYPHDAGAAFLVSTYPNLWLDLSEMVPFAGPGIRSRLLEILETAPLRKVLYGSDGVNVPETLWFASVEFKHRLADALDTLVGWPCDNGIRA